MLIPYNNERLYNAIEQEEHIFSPGHIDPAFARYEMHRVWVVEATVKQGERHIYEKRTFYLDEDSWNIVLQDVYNRQGELWRVGVRYSRYFPEVPVTLTAIDVFHDLAKHTYYFQALKYADYSNEPPQKGYFAPNAVRMRIKR